jgi:hypothetical protein
VRSSVEGGVGALCIGLTTHGTLNGYCLGTTTPMHETLYCPRRDSQQEYVDSSRGMPGQVPTGTVTGQSRQTRVVGF